MAVKLFYAEDNQPQKKEPWHIDVKSPNKDCSNCPNPGICCNNIPLYSLTKERFPTALHVMILMATHLEYAGTSKRRQIGLPFVDPFYDDNLDCWRFSCINLTDEGRCGDYENRPYGPCVIYHPNQDWLCAHHEKHDQFLSGASLQTQRAENKAI